MIIEIEITFPIGVGGEGGGNKITKRKENDLIIGYHRESGGLGGQKVWVTADEKFFALVSLSVLFF